MHLDRLGRRKRRRCVSCQAASRQPCSSIAALLNSEPVFLLAKGGLTHLDAFCPPLNGKEKEEEEEE
jgi:hypothetical protein